MQKKMKKDRTNNIEKIEQKTKNKTKNVQKI